MIDCTRCSTVKTVRVPTATAGLEVEIDRSHRALTDSAPTHVSGTLYCYSSMLPSLYCAARSVYASIDLFSPDILQVFLVAPAFAAPLTPPTRARESAIVCSGAGEAAMAADTDREPRRALPLAALFLALSPRLLHPPFLFSLSWLSNALSHFSRLRNAPRRCGCGLRCIGFSWEPGACPSSSCPF